MMRRDQADLCAVACRRLHAANPDCGIFERGAGVRSIAQYVRSMAWAGAVVRVIVGLPLGPRAGSESFSEQSRDRRPGSR